MVDSAPKSIILPQRNSRHKESLNLRVGNHYFVNFRDLGS